MTAAVAPLLTPRCLVLTTYAPHTSIDTMSNDIVFALNRFGIRASQFVRISDGESALFEAMMLAIGQTEAPCFVLDMNAKTNATVLNPTVGQQSLFDAWKLPRVSYLIDNLHHHADRIAVAPDHSITGCVDADSLDWIGEIGGGGRNAFHMPHAGPEPSFVKNLDRPIELLFAGNVFKAPVLDVWLAEKGLTGTDASIISQAVEAALYGPTGVIQAVVAAAQERGIEISLAQRITLAVRVEDYIRNKRRLDLFHAIRTSPITVYGQIEEGALVGAGETVTVKEKAPYLDLLDAFGRAKCVLNIAPSFRNGGHERIFYGLAQGCSVLTDQSRYLSGPDAEGLDLVQLPFDARRFDEIAGEVLSRSPGDWDVARAASLETYKTRHTWTARVKPMLTALRTHFPDQGFPDEWLDDPKPVV